MIRALALVLGLGGVAQAQAQTAVPDAAEVTQSVDLWLAGDEAAALPLLADQARAGNHAARLMLALIDMTPAYQGDWLAGLGREARIALMRHPGGISGQSWLDQAQGPLAAAWRALLDTEAGPEVVLGFHAMGEERAAVFAARTLMRRQNRALAQALRDAGVAGSLARFAAQGTTAAPDNGTGAPVLSLCARICPDAAEACGQSISDALNGDLALTESPAAAIVAPMDWAESTMASQSILRLIAGTGWRGTAPACLMSALPKP